MAKHKRTIQKKASEEIPKEIIPDEVTAPQSETAAPENQSELAEPTPEPTPMEVHHHAHIHSKSKWKEYFFQFFMLFLAVFCGFLAEYQLEHKIEHDREEVYMQSMLEDLKTDTARISIMVSKNKLAQEMADSLIRLLRNKDCDQYGQTMYYLARKITTINTRFELNDRTYEQMKNSGSLRLISDKMIADSVLSYYSAQRNLIMQQGVQITVSTSYWDYVGKVFDAAVFQQMIQIFPYDYKKPEGNPALLTHDPAIINEYISRLHYLGAISVANAGLARGRIDQTNRLIDLIKKEYHLE